MVQGLPRNVDSYLAGQETSCFYEPEISLPCSEKTTIESYLRSLGSRRQKISLRPILILLSHLLLCLPSGPFLKRFLNKILYAFLTSHVCYMPNPSHSSLFVTLIIYGECASLYCVIFSISMLHPLFWSKRSRRSLF
jgi:hypothetical protein